MCLEPECEPSLTWDCSTGEPQFDLGFSGVSVEPGDSDQPRQKPKDRGVCCCFHGEDHNPL